MGVTVPTMAAVHPIGLLYRLQTAIATRSRNSPRSIPRSSLRRPKNLIEKMELVQTYKDVTFEILNRKDFLPLIQEASPTVNSKRNFVQPARKRSEPLRPRLLGRPTSARVARNMSAARAFPNTWPVTAAVATCVLFFAPTVFAQPGSDSLGELLGPVFS